MKMKVVDAIRKTSDEQTANIIGAVILQHTCGISAEEAIKLDYPETLKELQREIEIDYNPTNADRIQTMSIDKLAEFLKDVKNDYQWANPDYPSEDDFSAWVDWLKSEAEG